jgi:hypothetical protein
VGVELDSFFLDFLDILKLFLDLVDHGLQLEDLGTGCGDQFAVFFN